jgi:ribosome maturation factor RimP
MAGSRHRDRERDDGEHESRQDDAAESQAGGTTLDARVESLLTDPIAGLGSRLLEARLRQEGRWVLRLTIDKPPTADNVHGAVTLDDCARVSELAGRILDVEDPIPHAFFLEVSSPGVFRPLKERRHYEQSVGKTIRLTIAHEVLPELKDRTFRAELKAVEGEALRLEVNGEPLTVPLEAVKKARLDPDL